MALTSNQRKTIRSGRHRRTHWLIRDARYVVVDDVEEEETVEEVPPVVPLLKISPSRLAGALAEMRSLPA